MDNSKPRPLYPWKEPVPLHKRLGGPQGRSEWAWKTSPSPGFDPRTVDPVASRYTVWAIPALNRKESDFFPGCPLFSSVPGNKLSWLQAVSNFRLLRFTVCPLWPQQPISITIILNLHNLRSWRKLWDNPGNQFQSEIQHFCRNKPTKTCHLHYRHQSIQHHT